MRKVEASSLNTFPRQLTAWLILGYCFIAHRLGEFYPFSPLSMFSGGLHTSSRLGFEVEEGKTCEIRHFKSFACERTVWEVAASECRRGSHRELDRRAFDYIGNNVWPSFDGYATVKGQLVRRVYTIDENGKLKTDTCRFMTCEAVPVLGACQWIR